MWDCEKGIVQRDYDRLAEAYAASRKELGRRDAKYLALLSERLPAGSKVLDLGCGGGVPMTAFPAERFSVTGVDFSERQIELARQLVPKATFLVADMTEVSFPYGSFDAACAILSIIHVPSERHLALFRRLHDFLKPGGLILASLGG